MDVLYSLIDTDEKYNANEIIKTEPAAGEKLKHGETIILYVKHIDDVYPDFTQGYSLSQIEAWCDEYSVELKVNYVETSEYSAGTIYKQSRNAGSKVIASQQLEIYIAEETLGTDANVDPNADF